VAAFFCDVDQTTQPERTRRALFWITPARLVAIEPPRVQTGYVGCDVELLDALDLDGDGAPELVTYESATPPRDEEECGGLSHCGEVTTQTWRMITLGESAQERGSLRREHAK
jgi:hypothetical protein